MIRLPPPHDQITVPNFDTNPLSYGAVRNQYCNQYQEWTRLNTAQPTILQQISHVLDRFHDA